MQNSAPTRVQVFPNNRHEVLRGLQDLLPAQDRGDDAEALIHLAARVPHPVIAILHRPEALIRNQPGHPLGHVLLLPLLGHVGKVPGVLCQSCLDLRDELLLVSPPTIINGVKIVDNIS